MKSFTSAILFFASSAVTYGVIQIADFSAATNDRFDNDASFIANSYNLSGVALANQGSGRWLTMVSENVFLSSNHYFPSNGTSATFYQGNDPSGTSVLRTIQKSQRVASSDIRIGTLNAGLGGEFSFYDFATDDISDTLSFINSPYFESDAYMFGLSSTSYTVSQDMAVGRNKLDRWSNSITAGGTSDVAIAANVDSSGDTNYLTYEAFLQIGDSGAPMMVDTGSGALTIVGMNWFKGTDGGTDVNGFSYVGNYDVEIQNYIDANPVPEVRMYSLFLGITAFFLIASRRKA
jgi:hypothetical protein